MNHGHQFPRRRCRWSIKNKPPTATATDSLKPQRPTACRGSVPPAIPLDIGKTTSHYWQTTRAAPMAQRIKTHTRETIYTRPIHRVTHNIPTNQIPQHKNPFMMPPPTRLSDDATPHQVGRQYCPDSCRRATKT